MTGSEPAFPCKRYENIPFVGLPDTPNFVEVDHCGLTKRELFAAMAMQGMLSNSSIVDFSAAEIAADARLFADALIAELAKEARE